MCHIVCLGVLCADVIVKPVDKFPDKGKLNLVDKLELHTGGCATNAAIDLAKLGIKPAIIGKVGDDGFGNFLRSTLEKEGVDVGGLKLSKNDSTSASVVLSGSDGERTFLHCLGSNAQFQETDIDFSIIKNTKILFVAGSLLMPKFDGQQTANTLRKAQEMGVYTALDTAWDSTGRWMRAIKPCLPYLDLFMPSIEEAEMISGKSDVNDMADVFIDLGAKLVVIKMGEKGCFIKKPDGTAYTIPAYLDVEAVDTTGAGDAFAAGFITGILKGWDLERCGKFANAVGAHCVMAVGASSGIKSLDEIMAFIKERE
ncbi:MAG TPA: carbohydrate kinase family protein [Clostridiales bacterium]|nr:carbohydrate kinase family protein [Clostridiales bacterium]